MQSYKIHIYLCMVNFFLQSLLFTEHMSKIF